MPARSCARRLGISRHLKLSGLRMSKSSSPSCSALIALRISPSSSDTYDSVYPPEGSLLRFVVGSRTFDGVIAALSGFFRLLVDVADVADVAVVVDVAALVAVAVLVGCRGNACRAFCLGSG